MKYAHFKLFLSSLFFIVSTVYATPSHSVSVKTDQELMQALKIPNQQINVMNDITLSSPIKLLNFQALNGNGHKLSYNGNSSCVITLSSGDSVSQQIIQTSADGQSAICGDNVSNVTISADIIISANQNSNGIVLNNSNSVTISRSTFQKSGGGNSIIVNGGNNVDFSNNIVQQTAVGQAVAFYKTNDSKITNNKIAFATGGTTTWVAVKQDEGNNLLIKGNSISLASVTSDCFGVLRSDHTIIDGNMCDATKAKGVFGIVFGDEPGPVQNTNTTFSNNNFTAGQSDFVMLYFTSDNTSSFNTQASVGNVLNNSTRYGYSEKGTKITGYVSFTNGAKYPQQ